MLENNRMLRTPSSWARAIAHTLEGYSVDVPSLFARANMDYSQINDNEAYYWQDSITQLWELALEETGDINLGLKVGRCIHANSYPALGYSLMACKDVQSSIERLFRYQQILAEGFEFKFHKDGDEYCLSFNIRPSVRPPTELAIDASIASFMNFLSWATQNKVKPLRARLARQTPSNTSFFEEVFECSIQYEAEVNELYFSESDMAFPLPTANEEFSKIHDANANRLLAQMNRGEITRQVRDLLIEHLPSGEPKLETIAQELHLSPSTFKRRMAAENTSFKALLEEIREELATNYLENKDYSITEITYLLGFSENSAFNRAFKRWKGVSPTKWAAEHQA